MPRRCKSIAGQKVTLGAGDRLIPGCELIDGSAFINGNEVGSCSIDGKDTKEECESAGGTWILTCEGGTEVFAPIIIGEDDMCAYAGANGATVLWPDVGNDLFQFDPGETVPVGTQIHAGQVKDGGTWFGAPHIVENEGAIAGPDPITVSDTEEDEDKGFCVGAGTVNLPTEEEEDWLMEIANFQIPDLQAWALSGFTAKIQEMMGKLNEVLGKLNAEVDKIMAKAVINPDDVCTPPVKRAIKTMLDVMAWMMEMMVIIKEIIKVIKIIRKVIKIVRKILKWTPPYIVPIVEKLMKVLNIMGLVDMCVATLIKAVGRFTSIIPILQAQLMSILAMCAAQAGNAPPDNKEDCEAAGGTWIDPDELKELQSMYDKLLTADLDVGDESIGFCSITEHLDKKSCEAAGGTWTDLDTDTDIGGVDTSALGNELTKQMEELERCFASPELKQYLNEL